jgi:type I restriction enzyme S subunit
MIWTSKTLGEIVSGGKGIIQTGPFGSQLHQSDYIPEGTPVVMPTDISDGRISAERIANISEAMANRLGRHKLKPRTIVVPRRGEITKRAFIREEQEGWLCGSGCLKIEVQNTELFPEFLYYYMEQHEAVQWLERHAVGSTMLNLSAGIVSRFPVRYPESTQQRRIASILSAYDEAIENNRRRMALLEKAARLLYEEWFVRLRFPGHEHTPVNDGVPQDWSNQKLEELAAVNRASLPASYNGEIQYVDISAVMPGQINETTTFEFRDAPCRARRVVKHGDIIWSCVRPNRRSHAVVWNPPENLIASTGFAVITPTTAPTSFLYNATTTDAFVGYLEKHAKGAAYPAVVAKDFERAMLLVPPTKLLRAFDYIVCPMVSQIHNLHRQNQKLRAARDLLLPRLMSGEIEV